MVTIAKPLAAMVEKNCSSCHDGQGRAPDLGGDHLKRNLVEQMLMQVYLGEMPKKGRLEEVEKQSLIETLISALWPNDRETRQSALAYFGTGSSALPVHRPDAIIHLVHARVAEAAPSAVETKESRFVPAAGERNLSPGLTLTIAEEALRACKAAKGANLARCLERAMAPEGILAVPLDQ
jgi:hypothetical protein